jgi:Holliday junction resolvase RusA-like endonuclease
LAHQPCKYDARRTEIGWALQLQKLARITGLAQIVIAADRPNRRRRDADNQPKAILDWSVARQTRMTPG